MLSVFGRPSEFPFTFPAEAGPGWGPGVEPRCVPAPVGPPAPPAALAGAPLETLAPSETTAGRKPIAAGGGASVNSTSMLS